MLRERMLQLEQTLERLFGGRPPREPLEVRRAVIESLVSQVQPVGRGRRVLPFNHATVHVVSVEPTERRVMKEALEPEELTRELLRGVERAGAQAPAGFTLSVRLVREPGKSWTPGARFHITVSQSEEQAARAFASESSSEPAPTDASAAALQTSVVLRVLEGEARPKTLTTDAGRITIGRQVEVVDQSGRPVRRNDVAFVGDDELSRSVSRAHAHLAVDRASGVWRVFDENSAHGTQVEREGRRITVPAGRDGLKLRSGDEIHVGRAILRFDLKPAKTA
jgi:hypothetical protein